MNSYEITGIYHEDLGTVEVSDKFKRKEFVVQVEEEVKGTIHKNYVKLQLVNDKIQILDRYKIGDRVKVMFNLRGVIRYNKRKSVTEAINNLSVYRVEKVD